MRHPGKDALRHLPDHTTGVPSIDPQPPNSEVCEGCEFGKSHRKPFPPSEKRATRPLELVHTDEDGPMRTKSISGHSYFVTFLDDYTGVGFAYFLKHKNEAAAKFLEFKAWAETQTRHKIKTV